MTLENLNLLAADLGADLAYIVRTNSIDAEHSFWMTVDSMAKSLLRANPDMDGPAFYRTIGREATRNAQAYTARMAKAANSILAQLEAAEVADGALAQMEL